MTDTTFKLNTPLQVKDADGLYFIVDATGVRLVAESMSKDAAAEIVRRCNAFDGLVGASKLLMAEVDKDAADLRKRKSPLEAQKIIAKTNAEPIIRAARAALAAAEKGRE